MPSPLPLLRLVPALACATVALAQSGTDDPPAGFETVFYDGVGSRGEFVGGHTLLPDPGPSARARLVPAPVATLGSAARGLGGDNRVDLVFVGDGYTAGELGTYQVHVNDVVGGFFDVEPLVAYQSYFAIHRVDVVSNESGVDNDPTQGISRDTALDMGFWCGGTERLLCVNVGEAYAYANNAPAVDQVIALANSTKYGGAGYTSSDLATSSGGNGSAVEIVKHELGHSLADLADEYTYGGPQTWTGGEPSRRNVSIHDAVQMASLDTKWADWLGASVAGFDNPIDTYEGANYSVYGIYRPSNNSLMRALNRPFNVVGAESLLIEVYRDVDPIDAASDPQATYGPTDTLWVQPMAPGGVPLSVQWYLDGQAIPGATSPTLDLATLGLCGDATVRVVVRDTTPWVRDEAARDAWMTQELVYAIESDWNVETCPTTPNSVGSGTLFDVAGEPSVAAQDLTLTTWQGPAGSFLLWFYGDRPDQQPLGAGTICVGGTIQRLALGQFDGIGSASYALDWNAPPIGSGPNAIVAGSTWYFQVWHRDAGPTGATFDFSNARRLTFCP